MRKGISIIFALAMFLSGAHFTIATHYCGGKVAATIISLTGKLASCGMEENEESCPLPGNLLKTHCCENKVATIGIINNYVSPVSIVRDNNTTGQQLFYAPVSQSFLNIVNSNPSYTDTGPAGGFSASAVTLNYICAFRI